MPRLEKRHTDLAALVVVFGFQEIRAGVAGKNRAGPLLRMAQASQATADKEETSFLEVISFQVPSHCHLGQSALGLDFSFAVRPLGVRLVPGEAAVSPALDLPV